jgi:phage replication-related protein YjqB (UPF0714/DUF867 family)
MLPPVVLPDVSRPTITTNPVTVEDDAHLTELLYDDGDNDEVLVCAAHGGRVEPGTAEQAVELATRLPGATCWATLGFDADGGEFERFHPPSTAVGPGEYPLLGRVADRGFETVLSLHGLAEGGVLVGGAVDDGLKRRVRDGLDAALSADVEVVTGGPYAGVHPENLVNWLADDGAGLQVEQGPTVRDDEGDAVVETLRSLVADGTL